MVQIIRVYRMLCSIVSCFIVNWDMSRNPLIPILFLAIAVSFASSCSRCACTKGFLNVNLISFTDSEAVSVTLRRFEKNSQFQTPVDSVLISGVSNYGLDTLFLPTGFYLNSSNDYELFFSKANITIQISDIIEAQQDQNCGGLFGIGSDKVACVDQIVSYKQNGVSSKVYSGNLVYITK